MRQIRGGTLEIRPVLVLANFFLCISFTLVLPPAKPQRGICLYRAAHNGCLGLLAAAFTLLLTIAIILLLVIIDYKPADENGKLGWHMHGNTRMIQWPVVCSASYCQGCRWFTHYGASHSVSTLFTLWVDK